MSKMDECGQEPVDERLPVLRACTHGPFPRPEGEPGLVTLVPQRTHCNEFSNHLSGQARDPPVADDCCTRRVPHHITVIGDQSPNVSPLTVHELVVALLLPRFLVQDKPIGCLSWNFVAP
ncbi:hypothetical protein [Streptomyces sp. NPDC093594]|uniref:hypothetical protein n=1 Tax=Streptomyces sp. NPDC093594 TaxID=3155305 RepID=UPI00344B0433